MNAVGNSVGGLVLGVLVGSSIETASKITMKTLNVNCDCLIFKTLFHTLATGVATAIVSQIFRDSVLDPSAGVMYGTAVIESQPTLIECFAEISESLSSVFSQVAQVNA